MHRGLVSRIKGDEEDVGRSRAPLTSCAADLDVDSAAIPMHCDRDALMLLELKGALDASAIGANHLALPIDNELRRVNLRAQSFRIVSLACGGGTQRVRILPAQIIPIVDMERKREQIGTLCQFSEDRIGRRA